MQKKNAHSVVPCITLLFKIYDLCAIRITTTYASNCIWIWYPYSFRWLVNRIVVVCMCVWVLVRWSFWGIIYCIYFWLFNEYAIHII